MATSRDAQSTSQRLLRSATPVAQSHALSRAFLPDSFVSDFGRPFIRRFLLSSFALCASRRLPLRRNGLGTGKDRSPQPRAGVATVFCAREPGVADRLLQILSRRALRELGAKSPTSAAQCDSTLITSLAKLRTENVWHCRICGL